MFGALAAAVDELHIPLDTAALREAFAIRDRLDARLAVAVGEFDAAGLYDLDAALTMQAWLRHHTRRDQPTANRLTMHGRKLGALPVLRQAFLDGVLTGGQVDVILANVRPRHVDRFADHEAALIPVLAPLEIDELRAAVADWKAKADALDEHQPDPEHENEVYLSTTVDGRGELRGSLNSDVTAVVDAALRVADCRDFDLTPAERRADALETVVRFFLDHQQTKRGGRHRPHVNVALSYEEFRRGIGGRYLDTGQPPSPAELGALLCDCALHRLLVEGRSAVLTYGRAASLVPPDLYNALLARDQGCRWPGCDRPAAWTDGHHVHDWDHGGRTDIENCALLCRRHHRRLHGKRGYSAKLLPDATFEVTFPDGRVEASTAPGPIPQQFWRTPGGG